MSARPFSSDGATVVVAARDLNSLRNAAHDLFAPQQALRVLGELLAPTASAPASVDRDDLAALVNILADRLQVSVERVCACGDELYR